MEARERQGRERVKGGCGGGWGDKEKRRNFLCNFLNVGQFRSAFLQCTGFNACHLYEKNDETA